MRTPLHLMSDDQLKFLVEDELVPAYRREIAEMLLLERGYVLAEDEHSKIVERLAPYSVTP